MVSSFPPSLSNGVLTPLPPPPILVCFFVLIFVFLFFSFFPPLQSRIILFHIPVLIPFPFQNLSYFSSKIYIIKIVLHLKPPLYFCCWWGCHGDEDYLVFIACCYAYYYQLEMNSIIKCVIGEWSNASLGELDGSFILPCMPVCMCVNMHVCVWICMYVCVHMYNISVYVCVCVPP